MTKCKLTLSALLLMVTACASEKSVFYETRFYGFDEPKRLVYKTNLNDLSGYADFSVCVKEKYYLDFENALKLAYEEYFSKQGLSFEQLCRSFRVVLDTTEGKEDYYYGIKNPEYPVWWYQISYGVYDEYMKTEFVPVLVLMNEKVVIPIIEDLD